MPTAVLTDARIAAEDLAAGQFDLRARAMDHVLKADDRRPGDGKRDGADVPAPVQHHRGLAGENQSDGPPGVADVERFKVDV